MAKKHVRELYSTFSRILNNPKNFRYEIDNFLTNFGLLSPEKWTMVEPIFIISTGRTGTKFLAKFLDQFNEINSVHEPNPDFLKLGIEFASQKTSIRKAENTILRYRTPMYRKIKRRNVKYYIESNNRLFSLIKPLVKAFDQPKILHIVRDGRDYVRSGMSRPYGGYFSDGDTLPRLKATLFPEDEYYEEWDEMSKFEKTCWLWVKKDNFIFEDIKSYSNSITIKFEEVFKDENHTGIKKTSDFIGFDERKLLSIFKDMHEKRVNKTKEYSIPHWKKWSEKKKRIFDEIAGEHMEKYGYY